MKRLSVLFVALGLLAAGCGSSSTSPSGAAKPTFTATLSAANEVPPIVGPEAGGTGNATITFDTTRDGAGNITAATATFVVNIASLPAGTPIILSHIHEGPSSVAGPVRVNLGLAAGEIVLANGSGSFTKPSITMTPEIAQQILNNPGGFYFNSHSALNPGGVVRGQLVRTQ